VRGSGIGLSLVKHIAQAHGGAVSVDSSPGRGSTFTVWLPVAQHADGAPADLDDAHISSSVPDVPSVPHNVDDAENANRDPAAPRVTP
jgi:hypothetical protein